ncbi:hypothetical protein [Gordonia sp. (in: high G+C Gram-positive bacteria)]|uniref:hypothetical protein n=1 Tax=Gordonia sp. (in: high G+C Gram-positive bacteria) TaxID=84139 RepID=UPI0035291402
MPAQAWVNLIAGLIAVGGVMFTIRQRTLADNRREWWARFEWALDATYSDLEDKRADGWRVVRTLAASEMMTRTEREIIDELSLDVGGLVLELEDFEGDSA